MKRNPELMTPWSQGGTQLLHYPDLTLHPNLVWRENPDFAAVLKLRGTERGRSAAYFRWEVVSGDLPPGTLLPMFITDVGHVLMNGLAEAGGVASGRWFVVKRGRNYGVTPVVQEPDTPARGQERPTGATGAPSGS